MPTIQTQWEALRKARSVNQTSASFVAKIPQAAEPSDDAGSATGQASIDMRAGGAHTQNGLIIVPYCVGSDNNTFSVRVIGWRRFGVDPLTLIWWPILLLEALCTADATLVGLAGKTIVATEIGADTITLVGTSGNANVSHELVSPADGVSQAHIIVDTKSCERIELSFSTNSSATSCNALVSSF